MMAIGADLRLMAMIRAISEVIIPAIPANQKLAIDQATIVLGNLKMLADQQDRAVDFAMAELREHLELIGTLAQAADGGPATAASAETARNLARELRPVAALPCPTQAILLDMAARAKTAGEVLVDAAFEDGAPAFRAAVANAVMAQAECQIERERAWTRAAGFDPPSAALDLDAILARRAL
jgi:hypothetical protein